MTKKRWSVEAIPSDDGSWIVAMRKELQLSQTDLALAMNAKGLDVWYQQTVAKVEANTRPLRLKEAVALIEIANAGVRVPCRSCGRAGSDAQEVETLRRQYSDLDSALIATAVERDLMATTLSRVQEWIKSWHGPTTPPLSGNADLVLLQLTNILKGVDRR